jgi:alkylhydroperoxidase/carboxymuconolactone decarboxylase family protein YurZ
MSDDKRISRLEDFRKFREQMNERILAEQHQHINRFFALDTRSFEAGSLDSRTKEMLGLVASMVLRCDDCIAYHLIQCKEQQIKRGEFFDIFNIALIVGGSIVIPHLRRAVELLDELEQSES